MQVFMSHVEVSVRCAMGGLIIAALSGCTSQQMYATGQQSQRQQCMQLVEQAAVEKCLEQANLPVEDYHNARDGR